MKRGFTLIEVLIAIAIFAVMASFMLVNYRKDQNFRDLKIETVQLFDYFKKAQTMSMANQQVGGNNYSLFSVKYNINDSQIILRGDSQDLEFFSLKKNKIITPSTLVASFSVPRGDLILNINGTTTATTTIKLQSLKDSNLVKCLDISSISGKMEVNNCP